LNFATAIGSGAKVSASNTIALGRPNGLDSVAIYGPLFANTINAATQYNLGSFRILTFGPSVGDFNLFAGVNAGPSNTGTGNSFFGQNAGLANISGGNNSFFGASAGQLTTNGSNNSFFGYRSGFNTTGSGNTFIGGGLVGNSNTTGSNNTLIGNGADVTSNNLNFATAIGSGSKVSSSNTIALGRIGGLDSVVAYGGLSANIIAAATQYNIGASRVLSASNTNTFVGLNTGGNSGSLNAFFGNGVASSNIGSSNSFFGNGAGASNVQGSFNVIVGSEAGSSNFGGSSNVFIGNSAGSVNTSGNKNTFIGDQGAPPTNTTGSNNTTIGAGADVGSSGLIFATAIGSSSVVSDSNTVALGRANGFDRIVIYGLGLGGSTNLCRNGSNQISTCSSSLRYKTDVYPFFGGLDIVKRLRPIGFTWKEGGAQDVGFGAEEVEKVEPLLTFRNKQGEIEGVKYGQISAVLVNAIKELQAQIERQRREIETMREQQSSFEALRKLVCKDNGGEPACQQH